MLTGSSRTVTYRGAEYQSNSLRGALLSKSAGRVLVDGSC